MTAGKVRILCYHGLWDADDGFGGNAMFMLPATFERRLDALRRMGVDVIPLSDAVAGLRGKGRLPETPVVITIDDGWHTTWEGMMPALKSRGMPATLYCDTAQLLEQKPICHLIALHLWKLAPDEAKTAAAERLFSRARDLAIDADERLQAATELAQLFGIDLAPYIRSRAFHYMTAQQLREVADAGIDIQLHTHNHAMHDMSTEAIEEEIAANRAALARILRVSPDSFEHFCYPSGEASEAAARYLADSGIASATTAIIGLASERSNLHLLPRIFDGDQLSELRFEAEISGFMHLMRSLAFWRGEAQPVLSNEIVRPVRRPACRMQQQRQQRM